MPLSTGIPRRRVSGSGSPVSVLVSITASALIDRAVDRHDLAGPHDDDVAGLDLLDRDLLEAVADAQLRDLRRALDQRGQLAARARRGDRLERRAAGEHQPDDDAGELLAERERADHRDQRDRVDAQAVLDDDRAADLDRELGGEQRDAPPTPRPRQPRRTRTAAADHDRGDRDRREDLRAMLEQPGELVRASARSVARWDTGARDRRGRRRGHDVKVRSEHRSSNP